MGKSLGALLGDTESIVRTVRWLGLGVGFWDADEDGLDVGPSMAAERKAIASLVPRIMTDGSITIRPQSGDSLGVHCDGKVGPNIGMRAPAILAQKVAHSAMAHGYGIQYPSSCQVICPKCC